MPYLILTIALLVGGVIGGWVDHRYWKPVSVDASDWLSTGHCDKVEAFTLPEEDPPVQDKPSWDLDTFSRVRKDGGQTYSFRGQIFNREGSNGKAHEQRCEYTVENENQSAEASGSKSPFPWTDF